MSSIAVSCTPDFPELKQKAEALAAEAPFFFSELAECTDRLVLLFTEKGLGLHEFYGRRRRLNEVVRVDFLGGESGWRLSRNNTIHQPLARAVGIRRGIRPQIFDATAGLGRDAFVLASLGCRVTLCERSPLPFVLLADGLARAAASESAAGEIVRNRMTLFRGDSSRVLQQQLDRGENFATIYFDPMFPHTAFKAQNKKRMRLLRDHVGDDDDAPAFMERAVQLQTAGNRITVKRPARAPFVSKAEPHCTLTGRSCRYDIYFPT